MRELMTRRHLWTLAAILGFAFAIRVIVALAMPNVVWPDEIFQSMEQGHRLAFGYGVVPWEFRAGARSWMLPGVLGGVMKVTSWVTSSVTAYIGACAALLSAISLLPVWGAFRLGAREAGLRGGVVAGVIAATWFELVYFAPKALCEVVAGNLLAFGIVLVVLYRGTQPTRRQVIVLTAVLALASMLRIQLSVAAFTVFVMFGLRLSRELKRVAIATGAAVVLGAGMLDWATWGTPFHSYIENIRVNVVMGKSSNYGVASWYAYFAIYARIWGMWAAPILALAVVGARRVPLLALGVGLVLLVHVPVAHKEYRFAYPAMLLVIMLAGVGAAILVAWFERRRGGRFATLIAAGLVTVMLAASLSGAAGFHGSKTQIAKVWTSEQFHWHRRQGGLEAMRIIHDRPDVCGVGLGMGWGDTGGYTYLHTHIPLYPFPSKKVMWQHVPNFNALLTQVGQPEHIGPFVRDQCWSDICLYFRTGPCEPLEGFDINDVLATHQLE
jgi:hypothetical protein